MKKIEEMTIDELKVIAYDLMTQTQLLQNKVNAINQLIAQKSQEKSVKVKEITKNKV